METILIVSVILVLVLGYTTFNLYRKVAKQEDIIEYQVDYLRKVSLIIQESKVYINQLDEKGTFQSDDEVGTFFNFMKEIQEEINRFSLPDNYGRKES
jgi:alpha-N-acetylglucosamine transferase